MLLFFVLVFGFTAPHIPSRADTCALQVLLLLLLLKEGATYKIKKFSHDHIYTILNLINTQDSFAILLVESMSRPMPTKPFSTSRWLQKVLRFCYDHRDLTTMLDATMLLVFNGVPITSLPRLLLPRPGYTYFEHVQNKRPLCVNVKCPSFF